LTQTLSSPEKRPPPLNQPRLTAIELILTFLPYTLLQAAISGEAPYSGVNYWEAVSVVLRSQALPGDGQSYSIGNPLT